MKTLFAILVVWSLASHAVGQTSRESADLPSPPTPFEEDIRFNNLTLVDGLSQGSVYFIHQDRTGFMWFGTQDGISRYDGYTFKNFKHVPFDSTSAQASWVVDAAEDSLGRLWIAATFGGLSRFDPATESFVHFQHDPGDSTGLSEGWAWATLVDRLGNVWVGTDGGGLNRMDAGREGYFEHFRHDPDDPLSLSSDRVRALYEDASGDIWVSTHDGLNRMRPDAPGRFERFLVDPMVRKGREHQPYIVDRVLEYPENVMWVGTKGGLVRLDVVTGKTKRFLTPENPVNEADPFGLTQDPRDPDVLWLAPSDWQGIVRFDTRTETYVRIQHDPGRPASPSSNLTASAFTDRSGTVWVGFHDFGVTKFNPSAVSFSKVHADSQSGGLPDPAVWALFADDKGNLWVAGNSGTLQLLDHETGRVSVWWVDPANAKDPRKPSGYVHVITQDPSGRIWLGTSRGLDLFDRQSGTFKHVVLDTEGDPTAVRSILVDRREEVWIGTTRGGVSLGVSRYDPETETIETFQHDPERSESIGPGAVWAIAEDDDGVLWFGRQGGVSAMDPSTPGLFRNFDHDPRDPRTITNGNVVHILKWSRDPGVLWLGTSGGGLDRFDTQTGEVRHYTEWNSGLSNNTIYVILEDENGRLWMSTNRGLGRFSPETETFTNFGIEHGLQGLEFNQYSGTRAPDGRMYFGGMNGVNAFYPQAVSINAQPPPVALTDLRLFNKRVTVADPNSPLAAAIDRVRSVSLTHDQARNVGFDFVALHYKNPDLNRYAYRLEGFDPDWIDAGHLRSATYTNLPPGRYSFQVRAANSDGVWNEEGAALALTVLPPWWRTSWAYVIYGLLFVGFLASGGTLQRRRLRKKAELEQAELRASAADSERQAAESRRKAAEAHALALEAENERKKDAELLGDVGKELTSTLDLDTIFDRVYEHVNRLVDAPVFGIGLYHEEEQKIAYHLAIENGKRYAPYTRDTNDKNQFPVWCIEHREPVFVNDVENEYKRYIDSYEHVGFRLIDGEKAASPQSLIYLPLISKDRVLGVISIQSFEKDAYSDHDLNILRALSTYTAIAVDNADAYLRLNATLDNLKNAQQQLVQQEKLASLGQLTAGIAHEIKNPLNFVTNFAGVSRELLEELASAIGNGDLDGANDIAADLLTNVDKIREHGHRADSIVRSMMQHARGTSSERVTVEVASLVEEYVGLAYHGKRASTPDFNVSIERDVRDDIGAVSMVSQDMGRVLLNLLGNAFDAVHEKSLRSDNDYEPRVSVSAFRHNGAVEIRVSDNGPGIPASIREKIFEPFFTTKPAGSGTGLGLSLSHEIVTLGHGGALLVESEEGKGTTFVVKLPG